MYVVCIYIYI